MKFEETFDYIVVGGGSTGCVVTNRLSQAGPYRVLLLEAGPPDDHPDIHSLTGFVKLWGSELDWQLFTEPQPALNNRKIMITQGKVLGGGSSVHAMMYVRGDRRDYDHWNFLGNEGWSYEEVLPYFKRSEDYRDGADEYHGSGGPMKNMRCPDLTAAAIGFLNAVVELGYGGGIDGDYNAAHHRDFAGPIQFNMTADGRRCSAADAFLTPILNHPNLTVKTGAEVVDLLFEGTRVVGLRYRQQGQVHQVGANAEVILSAGAFLSPKLLMLSGIGPAAHLRSHGIPVRADLPGVGQNLQDHMRLQVIYRSHVELPVPTMVAEAGLFARTRQGMQAASPDMQINFSAGIPGFPPPEYMPDGPFSIFVPILIQPQSRGEVYLRSANPDDPPVINPNYLQADIDVQTYIRGIELCRAIAKTQAFADFNNGEIAPGPNANLEAYVRKYADTIWHPVGTCKMGHDAMAVVDPQLRVRGIQGLRVADASIMPTIPSGNTNAACVMIGEKAADMILQAQGDQSAVPLRAIVRVVARVNAQPDKVAAVKSVLATLTQRTRQESGCIRYEVLQNQANPTDFTTVEEWATQAELEAHLHSEHLQQAQAALESLVAIEPKIDFYQLLV